MSLIIVTLTINIKIFSPSTINIQTILELLQNIRPDDTPPNVLNGFDHLLVFTV